MSYTSCPDPDDALHFVNDLEDPPPPSVAFWHVLIVDDEVDVHEATEFVLRDLVIEDRLLAFAHAYSAQEAYALLARDHTLAVILLDVVMESEDAGLRLVRQIREELQDQTIRIILRTGQPGYAPEIDTLRAYDINDYKTKSELTRVRLFTSLTVAIRSYRQIRQLEMSRRGLEMIISASTGLSKLRALRHFAEGVVTQLCALLGIVPEGLVCASSSRRDDAPRVIAAAGRYGEFIQCPLRKLPDAKARGVLQKCLLGQQHVFAASACLYFNVNEIGGIAVYVDISRALEPVDHNLLEVFCANVSVGFENVLLHQRLFDFAYHDQLLHLPNRNRFIRVVPVDF